jgi:glycerol-3-phosphate dehydrogenase
LEERPVLILGAGVNGLSLARELTLNGVSVWVVDVADLGSGATSRSSRLIHGGLRYLEYGDFSLVRESLAERSRLLQLAPHCIRPLRLHIPVRRRCGGWLNASFRFLGASRFKAVNWVARFSRQKTERGLWLIRAGLWFYDRFAARSAGREFFQSHVVHNLGNSGTPEFSEGSYRWTCSYSDAQMIAPERFCVALANDARQAADETGVDFRLLTYHEVTRSGSDVTLRPIHENGPEQTVRPAVLVNATGAWGDRTLEDLNVESRRLLGGTKGSHFITYHAELRNRLKENGIYAESADGRMVFVLPLGDGTLVGTTDERFEGDPREAIATDRELDYLIEMVNEVLGNLVLTREDISLHYSGVRPLPHSGSRSPGAISRGHSIEHHADASLQILTLVGGKLTTARAFGELVCDDVLSILDQTRKADTRSRPLPGGKNYPASQAAIDEACEQIADRNGWPIASVRAVWSLFGSETENVIHDLATDDTTQLDGSEIPLCVVKWIIKHEWVSRLSDLVERRLMLVYQPRLTRRALTQLAECLAETGRLNLNGIEPIVTEQVERLQRMYGRQI